MTPRPSLVTFELVTTKIGAYDVRGKPIADLVMFVKMADAAWRKRGEALDELKRQRAHEQVGLTWNEYCRQTFGVTEQYASRLILNAEYAQAQEDAGLPVPATPRQADRERPKPTRQRAAVVDVEPNPEQPVCPTCHRPL